ncbi:hypothetical protein [Modicisalibacter coralii]|uniref:hypothetical protein n=1 Tax=Modicisalibacter coralii TaxID=2304602 RepID=UPI00100BD2A9|nr:hypothetical protein [Halomonas coralii]
MNKDLMDLYASRWGVLSSRLSELDSSCYTNPFLISVDEHRLEKANYHIMIFGQETKGWHDGAGKVRQPSELMAGYDSFFCQGNFYRGYGRSSFWKAFRYFEKELAKYESDLNIYFTWNNINKIGRPNGKTGVDSKARMVERECFRVIEDEIQITHPDLVIFLTGPNRDSDIRFSFDEASMNAATPSHSQRAISFVSAPTLPSTNVRTYHPSYFGGFNRSRRAVLDIVANSATQR